MAMTRPPAGKIRSSEPGCRLHPRKLSGASGLEANHNPPQRRQGPGVAISSPGELGGVRRHFQLDTGPGSLPSTLGFDRRNWGVAPGSRPLAAGIRSKLNTDSADISQNRQAQSRRRQSRDCQGETGRQVSGHGAAGVGAPEAIAPPAQGVDQAPFARLLELLAQVAPHRTSTLLLPGGSAGRFPQARGSNRSNMAQSAPSSNIGTPCMLSAIKCRPATALTSATNRYQP